MLELINVSRETESDTQMYDKIL